MKQRLGIPALVLALCAGGAWYYYIKWQAEESEVDKARPEQLVTSTRIPAGRGSLTDEGKFVSPQGTETQKPATREEAEEKLRAALKIEELSPGTFRIGQVSFDRTARTVRLPAQVNMRTGVIEYVLTTEAGKKHEALLTTKTNPHDLHLACLLLGMKGSPLSGDRGAAMPVSATDAVNVTVTWETNGPPAVHPLSALISLTKGDPGQPAEPMPGGAWHYTGSRFTGPGTFAAQAEGSFISLIRDNSALLNNPGSSRDNDELHTPNAAVLPVEGSPVTVVLQLPAAP